MSQGVALLLIKLLEVLSLGLVVGPQIKRQFDKDVGLLKQMVEEGRDPTPSESADIDSDIDKLREELHKPI